MKIPKYDIKIIKKEEFSIQEAKRHFENAKETIKLAKKNDKYYTDPKYVKSAGSYLWHSILIAIDSVYDVKYSKKGNARADKLDYQNALAKDTRNSKNRGFDIVDIYAEAYKVIHLSMSYDGILSVNICNDGFMYAKKIIDYCELKLKK
ncbi:MAG: DUF5618 family protein [Bacteroidales bacterium]|jgi:hypothetical protein|nr:DUF5618 family protein [Bacteroidales bacterium]